MCLIVDNNVAAIVLLGTNAVSEWLLGKKGEPRLVVGGALSLELEKNQSVHGMLLRLNQAGRLRQVRELASEAPTPRDRKSDDPHVLALAKLSGARTLCTHDQDLIEDFKNPAIIDHPRGKVITDPNRKDTPKLLAHTPRSCGVGRKRKR